jgi:hypothetical protein
MTDLLLAALRVFNQILNAGNAITAFSLMLYALTFNSKELVARSFAILLGCVTLIYFGDVLAGTTLLALEVEMWLRIKWVGISFLPSVLLHLSDALLSSTGRPSKGRRKFAVRLSYALSTIAVVGVGFSSLVVDGLGRSGQTTYLQRGPMFWLFGLFMAFDLAFAGINLWRAYLRCLTTTSRRRMSYLMVGAVGPVLGGVPFLTLIGPSLSQSPLIFQSSLIFSNGGVAVLLVLMAYAVAYFGVSIPDRVVKSRLFQWIVRGPVVASTVLATTVIVNRFGELIGLPNSRVVPFTMIGSLLLLQFLITILRPTVERWLFYGEDRADIGRLQLLEERLLTSGDLRQYLESILNAVCDFTGSPSSFIAVVGDEGLELEVAVGPDDPLRGGEDLPSLVLPEDPEDVGPLGTVFTWDVFSLLPLRNPESSDVIGLLGVRSVDERQGFQEADAEDLILLSERAAVALTDRLLQREVFQVVDRLVPQVEAVQRMRAAARYGGLDALTSEVEGVHSEADLANLVKDALGHYWGGPRLSRSPLLSLRVVQESMQQHRDNPVNALRAILSQAIERVRPDGERRLTAEWMLYNILEMKFVQGRKVRDVAMRLAMSEADLYRKQRVAIEAVAQAIMDMERQAAAKAADEGTKQA